MDAKKYALSLVAYYEYDKLDAEFRSFMLDVGEGPKYGYNRVIGGWAGSAPPPKGLHPGPQYYKQLLSAAFTFNAHGRLVAFSCQGPATGNPDAEDRFDEFAAAHPGMTDAVALAELETVGAKYGPGDRDQFMRNVATKPLARFLGPFQVQNTKFVNLSAYPVAVLGQWDVLVKVTPVGESPLMYKLTFEQFNGDLVTLQTPPDRLITPNAPND
jgi:hypothetical protein